MIGPASRLREERDERADVDEAPAGRRPPPVHVDDVAERLERVERDARPAARRPGPAAAPATRPAASAAATLSTKKLKYLKNPSSPRLAATASHRNALRREGQQVHAAGGPDSRRPSSRRSATGTTGAPTRRTRSSATSSRTFWPRRGSAQYGRDDDAGRRSTKSRLWKITGRSPGVFRTEAAPCRRAGSPSFT